MEMIGGIICDPFLIFCSEVWIYVRFAKRSVVENVDWQRNSRYEVTVESKETFAEKVRYGRGMRFDSMMEEKGGWIAGEVPKHDVEMTDAVIEVMAEANRQGFGVDLNPFKEQSGEILPSNMKIDYYCGVLMRKDAITFKVNSQKLIERIALLKDQLLLAKFVGPKPPMQDMKLWVQTLHKELRGSTLLLCRNVGKGFFFLLGYDKDALFNALMLSPFESQWGTFMIQS